MNQLYMQRIANGIDNGYPMPLLVGQEWRDMVQPIYEVNNFVSWSGDGGHTTFVNSGTNALQAGDGIQIRNYPSRSDLICQVESVTDSTHFVVRTGTCSDTGAPYLQSGSGSMGAAYYWKREGTGMNSNVTWEIIDHGTTAGKYMLRNATRTTIAAGTPCTPDLHQSTCYVSHPVLSNAAPWAVFLEIDPSLVPACTMTGTLQAHNLALTSTIKFTLKATSVQTPATSTTREYIVCQDGAGSAVHALPKIQGGYEQLYKNDQEPIVGQVFANVDQYAIWSLTSDSGTGDATIETFNPPAGDALIHNGGKLPMAVFHSGTVTTGYTISMCSDFNPSSCTHVRRYVSGQTKPAGNADKVQLRACDIDPVMTGAGGVVYDIGPGQTYADLKTPPAWAFTWGSIFRIHNEASTVGSPVTFNNYVEFVLPTNYTSFATNDTVPSLYVCSIPNPTSGELAVIDGTNATASTHIGGFTGLGNNVTVTGIPVTLPINDVYRPDLQPMHHLGIVNLKIQNNGPGIYFYPPGQTTGTEQQWGGGSAIRPFALQNYTFGSNHMKNIPNGVTSDCNAQAGWVRGCSLDVMYSGNHFEGYGLPGQPTEHAIYCQDERCAIIGNLEDGAKSDQATGGFSMRGTRAHYMYNRVYGIDGTYYTPNGWGGNSEIQDAAYYFDINRAFGPTPGWDGTTCSDGTSNYPFCNPDGVSGMAYGGLATYAAFAAEHWDSLYMIGNALHSVAGANGGCRVGIPQTHGDNGLEMQHNMYYFYNLNDCPNAEADDGDGFFEDVRPDNGQNDFTVQPIDWPAARWGNSINWWNDNYSLPGGFYRTSFGRPTAKAIFQTNVFHVGQFTPTQTNIPLLYGNDSFNASNYGITPGTSQDQYTGMYPVEAKFGGWTSANFITSATKPYALPSLTPTVGSVSIGAASALPYPVLLYPPIFNATDANNSMARRSDPATIGPYDPIGAPSPVSIAILPNPISLPTSTTQALTCTTTLSDSTTRNCFSPACTSTNTASATISGLLVTATATTGTGTINCTAESLTAPGDNFTVTSGGPTPVSIAITPNPISLGIGASLGLTCTTTLSNATTRSCISAACTSTNTASATVSGLTVTATSTPGTGAINCSAESLTAPSDAFTVSGTPPATGTSIFGTMQVSGSLVLH
jgi:hypothetical protein